MRGERGLLFNRQIRLMMTEDLSRAVHNAATFVFAEKCSLDVLAWSSTPTQV